MRTLKYKVSVYSCPFCGGTDIDVGTMSAQSYGVKCCACGARIERYTPDKWPRGMWKKGHSEEANFERLVRHVLAEALTAWNTRSRAEITVVVVVHASTV